MVGEEADGPPLCGSPGLRECQMLLQLLGRHVCRCSPQPKGLRISRTPVYPNPMVMNGYDALRSTSPYGRSHRLQKPAHQSVPHS